MLLRTIALATADLVTTETLQLVVNQIQTTAQVAAIIAQWEQGIFLPFNNSYRGAVAMVLRGHYPITIPAVYLDFSWLFTSKATGTGGIFSSSRFFITNSLCGGFLLTSRLHNNISFCSRSFLSCNHLI